MQTSTEVYRQLNAVEFSEPQTRALIEILQTAGVIEPEPPETELERIEEYLLAEPFEPFVIGMEAGKSYHIERADQCGFTRHGSIQLCDVGGARLSFLSSDHIVRVQKV